jgi:small subunit ribosomal protein S6
MIETSGGEVFKEESWGKRKLAYAIEKLSEGNYTLFYIRTENGSPFKEVEQRMSQNERVLRFLTVRTDAGRLRHRGEAKEEALVEEATEAPSRNIEETG